MISIITVCHNSAELMSNYVNSFLKHNKNSVANYRIEFIFVENSGDLKTDFFAKILRENGYEARTIYVENRGFGAGCNSGAKLARGELLIFANPDIIFASDLTQIKTHFNESSWGTVRQIYDAGKIRAFDLLPEYRSLFTELALLFKYLHQFPFLYRFCYPLGSFIIIPRKAFIIEYGFDERFFLYYEEAELSRRLHKRLGPPKYFSNISIIHETFGSQDNYNSIFQKEAFGMVAYARITEQPLLTKSRLRTLKILSIISSNSKKRVLFLREAINAAKGNNCLSNK